MIISPFTPLNFTEYKSIGLPSEFTQFFSTDDTIYIQILRTAEEEPLYCNLESLKGMTKPITRTTVAIGSMYLDSYEISGMAEGFYYVSLGGEIESNTFEVLSDSVRLSRSVLIQYSPASNDTRNDVVAEVMGVRKYFSWRIPGGFKDSGWDFSVDNEQFVSQNADIVELYSRESVQMTLTVGWSEGVPIWFGQMLNRIFTCKYVYLDGLRYARYQSSVPEKEQPIANVNSFIFNLKVQRIHYTAPKLLSLL